MAWTDEQIDSYVAECVEKFDALQDAAEAQYGLGHFKRWNVDAAKGVITFEGKGRKLQADFYAVGSVAGDSFQWAWSNTSLPKSITQRVEGLKSLAKESGLPIFEMRKWQAGEQEAWEMVAIALARLGGVAGYRLDAGSSELFVVLTEFRAVA